METFIALGVLVIATVFVILLFYLIPVLKQLRQTAATAEKTLNHIDRELVPLLQQTKKTIEDINQITAGLKEQISLIEKVIENFRTIAERAHQITSLVYDQIELPIINVLNNINAVKKGIATFVNTLFVRRKEG
ncbi:MAG: DUF948 domain-containing protein [bacterium]|nr:DUF948 domain-containing protein [bacterium]